MISLVKSINLISIAAKNKKLNIEININPRIISTLNLLTNCNLIEYTLINKYKATITLKYKNQKPILKSINFMGGHYKNNVTAKYALTEFNNKKALYVIQTPFGLKTIESALSLKTGGVLLFKITL